MANTKNITISGKIPFTCDQHHYMRSYLGMMNAPSFGLRITYGRNPSYVRNNHGGETAVYDFQITGQEAVSGPWIEGLLQAIIDCGGSALYVGVQDIDGPQTLHYTIPQARPERYVIPVEVWLDTADGKRTDSEHSLGDYFKDVLNLTVRHDQTPKQVWLKHVKGVLSADLKTGSVRRA